MALVAFLLKLPRQSFFRTSKYKERLFFFRPDVAWDSIKSQPPNTCRKWLSTPTTHTHTHHTHTQRHYTTVVYFLIHFHGSSPAAAASFSCVCVCIPNKPGRWERWRARNDHQKKERIYPSLNFMRMAHGCYSWFFFFFLYDPISYRTPFLNFFILMLSIGKQTTVRR